MKKIIAKKMVAHRFAAGLVMGFMVASFGALGTDTTADSAKKSDSAQTNLKVRAELPATAYNATYLRDVQPIFMGKCYRCHNAQATFLPNWGDYKTAYSHRGEIKRRVWDSWRGHYYKQSMPAGNGPECQAITEQERALIKEWVEAGAALGQQPEQETPKSKEQRIESGRKLFATVCTPCHQATGQGIPTRFPPLAQSDFLNADKQRAIGVLLHGLQGEVVVNGRKFNNSMPSFPLSDSDIASALTYVYNSFGNSGKEVTLDEVKTIRAKTEIPVEQKAIVTAPEQPSPWE